MTVLPTHQPAVDPASACTRSRPVAECRRGVDPRSSASPGSRRAARHVQRLARPASPLADPSREVVPARGRRSGPPGRGHRPRPRRPIGRRRHRHRVGQVALLPGAHRRGGRRPMPRAPRCCSFPTKALAQDQLRALTALGVPGARGRHLRRRRHPRGSAPGSAATPTSCSPTPRCCTTGCSPTTRAGPRSSCACATSWSTSCTCCGASSARHVAHLLRRLRRLCAPLRRRPDVRLLVGHHRRARRGWPRRCAARRSRRSPTTARHAASGWSRCGTRRCSTRADRRTAARPAAPRSTAATARRRPGRRPATAPSPSAAAARAPRSWPPTPGAGCPPTWPTTVRPTAAATSPPSGGRSRPSCSAAACAAWSPPPPSSSASTSAASTPACSTGSPARSPRCGSRPAGPGASAAAVARRARRRRRPARPVAAWPTPTRCSTRPPEPAVVNPSNPFVLDPHLACAAYELPLTHDDERWWAERPRRRRAPASCSTTGSRLRRGRGRGSDRRRRAVWAGRGDPSTGVGPAQRRRPTRSASPRPTARSSAPSTSGRACERRAPRRGLPAPGPRLPGRPTLDLDDRAGRASSRADGGEYTQARIDDATSRSSTTDRHRDRSAGARSRSGTVEVTSQVTGYQRRDALHRRGAGHERARPAARPSW